MSRTKIFVSSTFFDLAQVRDDIRTTITELGHEALLNEYPSFPVNPSIDTIENCKKAVRSSDFFVLIIGGRRGSLDPVSGKSITNVEYDAALQSGIDCFIFVNEQMMILLEVWNTNPNADFSNLVDSPHVFEFIAKIKSAQQWIFTFKRASEISAILRHQLSVFLKDLLDRKRTGRLDPIREFATETARARQLALDRPPRWEYRLTEELLRSKLSDLRREYEDFEKGLLFRPNKPISALEYVNWVGSKIEEPITLAHIIKYAMERELPVAHGKPGEPGDAVQILRAVNKMANACRSLLDWELEIASLKPPSHLKSLGDALHGLTLAMIDELWRLPDEISKALEGTWTGTREVEIKLTFGSPPQLEKFLTEMKRVQQHPEWFQKP